MSYSTENNKYTHEKFRNLFRPVCPVCHGTGVAHVVSKRIVLPTKIVCDFCNGDGHVDRERLEIVETNVVEETDPKYLRARNDK